MEGEGDGGSANGTSFGVFLGVEIRQGWLKLNVDRDIIQAVLCHMSRPCLSESLECRIINYEKTKFIIIMYVC